jgi:thiamine-phosphate pyrophosphorylase
MHHTHYTIQGGLYLVVDPSKGLPTVMPVIQQAIEGGVDIIQIADHWQKRQNKESFIQALCTEAHAQHIPVLMHNDWQWLLHTGLDGVHFDDLPPSLDKIRQQVKRPLIAGLTCGNDLQKVQAAVSNGFDYISFCSMFPSSSAGVCEIVHPDVVKAARNLTSMPLFVAGGITPGNLATIAGTGLDGVAVVSGIMNAASPGEMAGAYKKALYTIKNKQP